MTNLTGQSLGRYHILEQLGEGGMATVYKGYDTRLKRDVAVKVIRIDQFAPAVLTRSLKRFKREAKALAHINHPNIVPILDFGEHEGAPYLVMPYLPGGTLKERLVRGPLPWQQAVRLLMPIADALAYAHDQGIIHRDIKPANILFTQFGAPMLADFGVAKLYYSEETSDLTGTGMGVGTPEYTAPEQMVGENADQRGDIYSLGIVFYEMVTGRKPFHANTPMAVLYKHINERLPKPKQYTPDLPDPVEQILYKALAKKPDDRYQTMAELARALEGLTLYEKEYPAGPTTLADRSDRRTRDEKLAEWKVVRWRPWAIGIIGLILIAAVVFGLLKNPGLVNRKEPTDTPSPTTSTAPTSTLTPTLTSTPTASPSPTITPTPIPMPISVANAANVAFLRQLKGPYGGMAFSPNGEILASGMGDASVGLWRVSDGVLIHKIEGHSTTINSLSFSPDGQILALTSPQ